MSVAVSPTSRLSKAPFGSYSKSPFALTTTVPTVNESSTKKLWVSFASKSVKTGAITRIGPFSLAFVLMSAATGASLIPIISTDTVAVSVPPFPSEIVYEKVSVAV